MVGPTGSPTEYKTNGATTDGRVPLSASRSAFKLAAFELVAVKVGNWTYSVKYKAWSPAVLATERVFNVTPAVNFRVTLFRTAPDGAQLLLKCLNVNCAFGDVTSVERGPKVPVWVTTPGVVQSETAIAACADPEPNTANTVVAKKNLSNRCFLFISRSFPSENVVSISRNPMQLKCPINFRMNSSGDYMPDIKQRHV